MNLPRAERFDLLARGLQMLGARVEALDDDAAHMYERGRRRSADILDCFANEEAAKVMVLLDIARAGWADRSVLECAFGAFKNHLARGLYVEAYEGSPATLGEVRRHVDRSRRSLYLDGPNEVDWIFRNEILNGRESRLYVDLIADDDGRLSWTSPADRDDYDLTFGLGRHMSSRIVRLTQAMHRVGLLSESGLKATEEAWRAAELDDDTHWVTVENLNIRVLERLDELQAAHPNGVSNGRDIAYLIEHWCFPLTGLDLSSTDVSIEQLRREQQAWMSRMDGW